MDNVDQLIINLMLPEAADIAAVTTKANSAFLGDGPAEIGIDPNDLSFQIRSENWQRSGPSCKIAAFNTKLRIWKWAWPEDFKKQIENIPSATPLLKIKDLKIESEAVLADFSVWLAYKAGYFFCVSIDNQQDADLLDFYAIKLTDRENHRVEPKDNKWCAFCGISTDGHPFLPFNALGEVPDRFIVGPRGIYVCNLDVKRLEDALAVDVKLPKAGIQLIKPSKPSSPLAPPFQDRVCIFCGQGDLERFSVEPSEGCICLECAKLCVQILEESPEQINP